jgi:hypothetical protein
VTEVVLKDVSEFVLGKRLVTQRNGVLDRVARSQCIDNQRSRLTTGLDGSKRVRRSRRRHKGRGDLRARSRGVHGELDACDFPLPHPDAGWFGHDRAVADTYKAEGALRTKPARFCLNRGCKREVCLTG